MYYERSGDFDVPGMLANASRKQVALRHVWYMELTSRRMATSVGVRARRSVECKAATVQDTDAQGLTILVGAACCCCGAVLLSHVCSMKGRMGRG